MAQDAVLLTAPSPTKGVPASSPGIDPRGPYFAVVIVGTFLFLTITGGPAKPDAALSWTLNPTGYLGSSVYVLLYFCSIPAKELANSLLGVIAQAIFQFRRMDEGEGKVRKLEVLETIDLCYLALNTMVEFIGMNHIVAFLLDGPVEKRIAEFGIVNGPAAFLLIMCLNDIIYYPFHLVAHKRSFYPYVHKQHHRQFVPFRGYADAANQHPFEQIYGFSIFIMCLYIASKVTGLHASTAWFCFLAWAILNIGNHLAFDSNIHLPLPYPAYPRDHQMHHRFPQCNYSTLTTFCDRAFGTFRSYRELGQSMREVPAETEPVATKRPWYETTDPTQQTKKKEVPEVVMCGRPDALPSAFSILGLLVGLALASVVVECFRIRGFPSLVALSYLLRPAVLLVNLAVVSYGIEAAFTPVESKEMPRAKVGSGNQEIPGAKSVFKDSLKPEQPKAFKRE